MRRPALLALAILTAGCTTVGPLRPLSGGTALEGWHALVRAAGTPGTLSSYVSVRVTTPEGRRSFRATIETDSSGAVQMRAFTPVGTEVFAFEVRSDMMSFADHRARASWRGPFSDLASQLGIPEALGASSFARLAFGLPAAGAEPDFSGVAEGLVRQGELEYEVAGVGLKSVMRRGSGWRARFDPPSFPPAKVTFEDDSGRSIVVRHFDASHSRKMLSPLVIDSAYSCCHRPVLSQE